MPANEPTEIEIFVQWCEARDVYPVNVNQDFQPVPRAEDEGMAWDWSDLLNVWEVERRLGIDPPPAPVTPIGSRRRGR